jgi:cysteine-rich repeat protein
VIALALLLSCRDGGAKRPSFDPPADAGSPQLDAGSDADAGPSDPTERVFSMDALHEIRIDLAAADRDALAPGAPAVACTLSFDGEDVPESALAIDGPTGLGGKASFALGFGLGFSGLTRLDLDGGRSDPSRLRDHVAGEIARAAGIAAPRTAFAAVTVDGEPFGLYGIEEAIDEDFLERSYGDASGNLYVHPGGGDFAVGVTQLVNNGGPKGDTSDLELLVAFIESYPFDPWMTGLADVFDLDLFVRSWAVDAIVARTDGYLYAYGPTWLYDRAGRFVLFGRSAPDTLVDPLFDVDTVPDARVGRRTWNHADGHAAYAAALRSIVTATWDADALLARLDEADALVSEAADSDPRAGVDPGVRAAEVRAIRDFLAERGANVLAMLDAVCGNGAVELGEACDDGNTAPRDGCDERCEAEYCGDGVLSAGEACDDAGCLPDCSGFFVCGDGALDPGEACDLGDVLDDDGCTSVCTLDQCGDGIVQPSRGETCDGVGCRPDCSALGVCGDGTIDTGEDCDDMDADELDGCLSDCSFGDCAAVADVDGEWIYCTALRTFDASAAHCARMGATLGIPADESANAVVAAETLARLDGPWWIGGTDRRVDGAWRDVGGAPVAYLPFGSGEPNGGTDQNCLVIETRRFDGGWNDKSCDQLFSMVCRH